MRRAPTIILSVLFLLGAVGAQAHGQSAADHEGVRRAVLDYVEGFYEGDTAKLVRSIRPDVQKFGFWMARDSVRYGSQAMPWPEFLSYARHVRERGTQAPPTAPKAITVFDVQDQTASAKLTASWGTDYLLLARYDGRWMVRMVLWQTPPVVDRP
ncbi:MAG TPA: nuclear transport factor 2 family protein [Gemmatimonadaceae bacterium]|nr:nuclear transport factor 2 family protein [Gemmatimonadaceae bacterium]